MTLADASKQGEIAGRLRLAREMSGLTQGQAAKRLKIHRPTISELEAGRRRLGADEVHRFACLYDVSIQWLLGEKQEDEVSDRVRLAARRLEGLRAEDLDKLMALVRSLNREAP